MWLNTKISLKIEWFKCGLLLCRVFWVVVGLCDQLCAGPARVYSLYSTRIVCGDVIFFYPARPHATNGTSFESANQNRPAGRRDAQLHRPRRGELQGFPVAHRPGHRPVPRQGLFRFRQRIRQRRRMPRWIFNFSLRLPDR